MANTAIATYQDNYQYAQAYFTHFTSIVLDIVTAIEITKQTGNTLSQITQVITPQLDENGVQQVDAISGEDFKIIDNHLIRDAKTVVLPQIDNDWKNYVEFNTADGSISPTLAKV